METKQTFLQHLLSTKTEEEKAELGDFIGKLIGVLLDLALFFFGVIG